MTRKELFEQEQNNPAFFKDLDSVISVFSSKNTLDKQRVNLNWFSANELIEVCESSSDPESLLSTLVSIEVAESKPKFVQTNGFMYRVKPHLLSSTSLSEQFKNWKQAQEDLKPKGGDNITGSIVFKDSPIQDSQLQFDSPKAIQKTKKQQIQPDKNESEIIKFIKKFWWLIIIPIVLMVIKQKWIIHMFTGE